MIFAGSGCTGAIDKLIGVLGLRIPSALEDRWHLSEHIPRGAAAGGVHRPLRAPLQRDPVARVDRRRRHHPRGRRRPRRPGRAARAARGVRRPAAEDRLVLARPPTSPASSPTPTASPTLLHEHGALAFWDFAAAAPYVDIEMTAPADGDPLAYKDAIFLSPHKFIGGPSTPGVLVARRELFANRVPDVPGGGTVAYVNPDDHAYLADPAHREEGGTPAIIEAVRAGLVFQLKEAVGVETIRAAEERLLAPGGRGVARGAGDRDPRQPRRRPALDRVVRRAAPSGRYLHHNFVVALLNDLFGIQSRGGCSCAGPYGHRLLGIDLERSPRVRARDHRRLRGHQARLGAGELQLLPLRHRRRLHHRGGAPGRPRRLAAARRLPVRPAHRALAAPRRAGRAADPPARDLVRRRRARCRADARTPAGERTCSPSTCATGAAILAAAARAGPVGAPRPTSAPTSSTCAGSTCPRAPSPTERHPRHSARHGGRGLPVPPGAGRRRAGGRIMGASGRRGRPEGRTPVPTTFGIVAMGLMLVGAVAGLVIWGLQITRRASSKRARGSQPGAPFDENTAAAMNVRSADRNDLA